MCLPTLADAQALERDTTEKGFEYSPDGKTTSVKLRFQLAKGGLGEGIAFQP